MENNNQKDNQKETIEINIMGIRYRVSSKDGEGNAYVKQAAEYVSSMYDKLKTMPGFTRRSKDYQNLMMYLNMADDYLKASEWTEERQLAANTDAANEITSLKKQLQDSVEQSMATEQALRDEMVHLKKKVEYSFHERNHYMEQQRNSEAKTMALEKEVAGYKTETSVMKRKMEEMRKDAEDAVKLRKEAATRTKDWENAMLKLKDELTQSYEAKIRELTEGYEAQLSSLRTEQEAKLEEARAAGVNKNLKVMADCDENIAQMKAVFDAETQRIKEDADARCERVNTECEEKLTKKDEECETKIKKTNEDRDRMIRSLKEDNESKLSRMKTAQDAKISRIMAEVSAEKGDITAPFEKEIIEKEQELARRQKLLSAREEELIILKDKLAEAENKIASLSYKLQEAEIDRQ